MADNNGQPPVVQTMPGMISQIGSTLISTLPPAFIVLVALNIAFLGLTLWFIDGQRKAVALLMDRIITSCLLDLADTKMNRAIIPRQNDN